MIPYGTFELDECCVHVWALRIKSSETLAAELGSVLTFDEKERAARFRFHGLRHSFVITRGILRYLLGRYLDLDPANIRFRYGPNGKPALAPHAPIGFNVAHSGDMAVLAFAINCDLGIDVEQIRPLTEAEGIAARFFCPEEAAEIMSLPLGERLRAFFRCWTRKEAYMKAVGDGLSAPLDGFRVTVRPGEPACFIPFPRSIQTAKAWTLYDLSLDPDYASALAYREQERPVAIFSIDDPSELIGVR